MSSRKMSSWLVVAVFLLCGAGMVFAAGAKEAEQTGKVVIGVSMDTVDHPFWQADIAGMKDKAKEQGVELDIQVAQGDANVQNKHIEDMLAKGVSAVICAAKDSKAILQAVKKCNEKKVPFIYNDRAVYSTADAKVDWGAGTDNYLLAKSGWEWMVKYAREKGLKLKVLELVGDLADNNVLDRSRGFKDVMEANKDIVQLVASVPTEWNLDKALAGTTNALQANKEINCIYMHSDYLLEPTVQALKQANKYFKIGEPGHVIVMPFGGSKNSLDGVRGGWYEMCFGMNIYGTGQQCVQAAVDHVVDGKPFGPPMADPGFIIDASNIGTLGATAYGAWE
jgi:ABC-type sugar transport system substrate-binding protein